VGSHTFLVGNRISRLAVKLPAQERIGVVRLVVRREDCEALAVVSDLSLDSSLVNIFGRRGRPETYPVTLDILQILREVGKGTFKDFAVEIRSHSGLHVNVVGISFLGLGKDIVGSLLDSFHE
jgi:hypothetical protein